MQISEFFDSYFGSSMPCAFNYNGVPADEFSPLERAPELDGEGFRMFTRRMDAADGRLCAVLKVRLYATAVEWWLEFSADSAFDSHIISDIKYARLLSRSSGYRADGWRLPMLHWAHGSLAQADDFMPVSQNFTPETRHVLHSRSGRASSGTLPYFNLQLADDRGCFFAIGWAGGWRASFERKSEKRLLFTAEMDDARFRVRSGETLVMPKVLALPWEGAIEDSWNRFRRFILGNVLPRYNGKPLEGYVALRSWGGLTPEIHRAKFDNIKKHMLGAEMYQIDAGWHGDETTPPSDHYYFDIWHKTIGTWKPLPALYPDGLSALHNTCRDAGMDLTVWFEPERMMSWNRAVREHRDYFIGPVLTEGDADAPDRDSLMVNIGDPEARKWLTDILSDCIAESGMECLRIDYNYEPSVYWRYADGPDRRGIAEIKYVNGLYAMLDELLIRHPGLKIDNCASGGRRLDYRMFRRSMPMICRSDYFCAADNEPEPKQAHTYGLSMWLPATGDSLGSCIGHTPECMDTYRVRSSLCSGVGMTAPWWELTDEEAAWYRKMIAEAKRVREYVSHDFYPLTGCSFSELDWMAYQFHDPDADAGVVMAYRRPKNALPVNVFALRGLDEDGEYCLEDADSGDMGIFSGKALKNAFEVAIPEKRGARLIFYRRLAR